MQAATIAIENPFAVLSFLAAPAILTNASTLLSLSTANRLGKVSDRARSSSAAIMASKPDDPMYAMHKRDFDLASKRAVMLVESLRLLYMATGSFAAGTCIALLGVFGQQFGAAWLGVASQGLTVAAATVGLVTLVLGSARLFQETRVALQVFGELHAAMTQWRARSFFPPGAGPG